MHRGLPRGVAGDPGPGDGRRRASTPRCSPPRRARTTAREQATCDGWPLYTFAQDAAPGDVTGQGVGDNWYVLDATCTPVGMVTVAGTSTVARTGARCAGRATPVASPDGMATLRFSFGTMGSGKSTVALQIHHNLSLARPLRPAADVPRP